MKPVVTIAPLPYPNSQPDTIVTRQLDNFDRDLRKTLVDYLFTVAFRLNNTLPKDGSEPMSGSLNMGGFDITNVGSITTSGNITIGGTVTASMARLTSTADVSLSSTDHAFQIGDTAGQNIAADANEIQSRNNGATATLFLQNEGGDLQVGSNTSSINMIGGKLKFPATQQASTDVNTLDDYREVSWTPALAFGGASVGITYVTQVGLIVKIGRLVHIAFRIDLSSKGSSVGDATITGSPISSPDSNASAGGSALSNFSGLTGVTSTPGIRMANSAIIGIHQGITSLTNLNDTHFTNTTILRGSFTFIAAS